MPDPIVIDKPHARRFLLAHLHLLPPRNLQGKQGVLDFVRHLCSAAQGGLAWSIRRSLLNLAEWLVGAAAGFVPLSRGWQKKDSWFAFSSRA